MQKWMSMGLVLLLAACGTPSVDLNPPQSQFKIGSVQHWQLLASRTADNLAARLPKIEEVDPSGHMVSAGTVKSLARRPLYIHTSGSDSPFANAFTPLLQEELMKRGFAVARSPRNATVINYEPRTYLYGGNGVKQIADWTTLGAGLGLATLVGDSMIDDGSFAWSSGTGAAAFVAAGAIIDGLVATRAVTNAEVVLTTSIVAKNTVLFQSSETLYATPHDLPFYWSNLQVPALMDTVNMQSAVETVQTIRIAR